MCRIEYAFGNPELERHKRADGHEPFHGQGFLKGRYGSIPNVCKKRVEAYPSNDDDDNDRPLNEVAQQPYIASLLPFKWFPACRCITHIFILPGRTYFNDMIHIRRHSRESVVNREGKCMWKNFAPPPGFIFLRRCSLYPLNCAMALLRTIMVSL